MKGVHCVMRPAIAGFKLRRSIGITRAYLSKALEYGFDAAFVDVTLNYGLVEPDSVLLDVVDSFIKMDSSVETKQKAESLIKRFI